MRGRRYRRPPRSARTSPSRAFGSALTWAWGVPGTPDCLSNYWAASGRRGVTPLGRGERSGPARCRRDVGEPNATDLARTVEGRRRVSSRPSSRTPRRLRLTWGTQGCPPTSVLGRRGTRRGGGGGGRPRTEVSLGKGRACAVERLPGNQGRPAMRTDDVIPADRLTAGRTDGFVGSRLSRPPSPQHGRPSRMRRLLVLGVVARWGRSSLHGFPLSTLDAGCSAPTYEQHAAGG